VEKVISYQDVLPGLRVSGILVQEEVVRWLGGHVAVAEDETWTAIVDVAVCLSGEYGLLSLLRFRGLTHK
jgi:hypothetical protein